MGCHVYTYYTSLLFTYRTVKNFGGQKVWRKELMQGIGGKNFGKKSCVVSCNQLEISAALPFRQVSKCITNVIIIIISMDTKKTETNNLIG